MCNTWYGLGGALCNEICVQGQVILGILTSTVFLSLCVGILGSTLLIMYLVAEKRKVRACVTAKINSTGNRLRFRNCLRFPNRSSPLLVTLILTTIGALCICFSAAISAYNLVGFPLHIVVITNPVSRQRLKRSSQFLNYENLVVALGYCFTASAVALLPVTWVRLSRRIKVCL